MHGKLDARRAWRRVRTLLLPLSLIASLALGALACSSAGSGAANDGAANDAAPASTRTVTSGDVKLHVHVAGDPSAAEVFIALHGGPGMTSDYLASLDQLATAGFAVVRYDQRGSGQSSAPSTGGYTLREHVGDVEAVRQALVGRNGKVHLFGHSWGGLLALAYASMHRDALKTLTLFSAAPPTVSALLAAQHSLNARIAALQKQGVIPDPLPASSDPKYWDDVLPAYLHDPKFAPPPELRGMTTNAKVNQATILSLATLDIASDVAKITVPTLVLFGVSDPLGPAANQATLAAFGATKPKAVSLQACGHFYQECPTQFFRELRAFVQPGR